MKMMRGDDDDEDIEVGTTFIICKTTTCPRGEDKG